MPAGLGIFAGMKKVLIVLTGIFLSGYIAGAVNGYGPEFCAVMNGQDPELVNGYSPEKSCGRKENGAIVSGNQSVGMCLPLRSITVTSPYGRRPDPLTGKRSFHSGLDLRASFEPVFSMLPGTVLKTGSDSRSGKYVVLKHGGITVSYCHLSAIRVRPGQRVTAGQVIAISGNSGRSTGPHLHLTVKTNGRTIDPAVLIRAILKRHNRKST